MATTASNVTIEGRIERFLSGPTADGFAIVKLTLPSGKQMSIKGKSVFAGYTNGDAIKVVGRKVTHPKFGDQVDAIDVQPAQSGDTLGGMMRWIAQAGIEGVGEATAAKLVRCGGENTIDQIINGDAAMREILKGKFDQIREALMPRYGEAKFGAILAAHDIGRATRIKIYEAFGERTLKILNDNPYVLIHAVDGIAFQTADQIARKTGIAIDSEERIIAAAHATLRQAEVNGDSWVPMGKLIEDTRRTTGLLEARVNEVIANASCQDVIEVEGMIETETGLELTRGWALARLATRETAIARMIADKREELVAMGEVEATQLMTRASQSLGVKLNDQQREAVIMALIEPISVITGFPGTGKTTVLAVITKALKMHNKQIELELASPTGKAAQRMNEKTRHRARTIHRLLGANGRRFRHDDSNPLDADYIAIDEATMLDIDLAHALFQAWGQARILLIGDVDQLPSVGAGRVFGDIISSGAVPVTRLTEIRRQAKGSGIALGAAKIRAGEVPAWSDDLVFIESNDNEHAAKLIRELHQKAVNDKIDIQVLTPGHQSEVGTRDMNRALAEDAKLNGPVARIAGGAPVRAGDKVIQTANDSELDVYNGDAGRVEAIASANGEPGIVVRLSGEEDRRVHFDSAHMGELDLAYALTVHKAQGSEYDEIIVPLTTSHWMLLTRTLLNTAVTRAAVRCTIIGSKRALKRALANDDAAARCTQLKQLLMQVNNEEDYDLAA